MTRAAKEVRTKIKSIKSTQKITRAMEMVAASKMRRAQQRMTTSRPYAKQIRRVIGHLAKGHPEYRHPYLEVRDIKRVGIIVVSSDRGLCGGLNTNLLKTTVATMAHWQTTGAEVDLCLIGSKAELFFKRYGGNVIAQTSHMGDAPSVTNLVGLVKVMLNAYRSAELDGLFILYNEFVNTMSQKPQVLQLLPLVALEEDGKVGHHWDYIYEPDAKELLDTLLTRYIESQVYQAVVENLACEQAARMVAMKSASDNASELINQLQLVYNKARQATITQELAEIVGGAAAV